jgi:sensor histidine kinase regulating citrate/malate metabolism
MLPNGVRISIPSTNESFIFFSSKEFLGSILENIFRNSIEAVQNDGLISIDYIYDFECKQLTIEISDNGPGIPNEIVKSIQNKQVITSSKENGSGIGMLTVSAMLDRIEGFYSLETGGNKGTKWTITLNDLEEIKDSLGELGNNNFENNVNINSFIESY